MIDLLGAKNIVVTQKLLLNRNFSHASTGNLPKGEEKAIIMAALMVMGTNNDLVKMSDSTPERKLLVKIVSRYHTKNYNYSYLSEK